MSGHQEEWTSNFKDGRRKIVLNEEIAFKGYGASITAARVCGGSIVLLLMIPAAFIGARSVKQEKA